MIRKNANKSQCVMLLSDKSSGSSMLQRELSKHPDIHIISQTRHFENETLYWNKAAALLHKPQEKMRYSELPYSYKRAKKELTRLLFKNLSKVPAFPDDTSMVFSGWHLLCTHYKPIFFEKSPHHLHDWSALELIKKCMDTYPDIDFYFIGLIRNPMDTLYSMWKRWKAIPEKRQYEWVRAYKHLLLFKNIVKDRLLIIRYEDLISQKNTIKEICHFIGIEPINGIGEDIHTYSFQKWKHDTFFGFQMDKDIISFAEQFYKKEDLVNKKHRLWTFYRNMHTFSYRIIRWKVTVTNTLRQLSLLPK